MDARGRLVKLGQPEQPSGAGVASLDVNGHRVGAAPPEQPSGAGGPSGDISGNLAGADLSESEHERLLLGLSRVGIEIYARKLRSMLNSHKSESDFFETTIAELRGQIEYQDGVHRQLLSQKDIAIVGLNGRIENLSTKVNELEDRNRALEGLVSQLNRRDDVPVYRQGGGAAAAADGNERSGAAAAADGQGGGAAAGSDALGGVNLPPPPPYRLRDPLPALRGTSPAPSAPSPEPGVPSPAQGERSRVVGSSSRACITM